MDKDAYSRSTKADVISIINKELLLDEDILYRLSVELLNVLFSVIRTKSISIDSLRDIISHNVTSNAILQAIQRTLQSQPPMDIPTTASQPQAPIDIPTTTSQPQAPIDIPTTAPQPQASIDIPTTAPQPQAPIDIPDTSTRTPVTTPDQLFSQPAPAPLFSQDSIKADIIPVIRNMIDVSSEKLFSLSVDTLNQIFGFLEAGTIPSSEIENILRSTSDDSEISSRLQAKVSAGATSAPSDSYKEDIITGILFNIPESVRDQIEPKIRELENADELVELSQLDLPELQSKLGIDAPAPQRYDEGLDLRAGILAQIPPSLRGAISDRLNEIDDLDQLYRLSQMNYIQVQQSLGLAPQSASQIPPELANPVDTATETPSVTSRPAAPSDSQTAEPALPPEQKERLEAQRRQRMEENKKHVPIIQKMAEKAWKIKLSGEAPSSPEAAELKEKIDILLRIHSTRVERILDVLKRTKDRKRFMALFDWYAYSQRIEEIETYVEHWQGQVQGIGGFRAAINVSRFDPIIEHLSTKEVIGIDIQAKKALERVLSTNINTRARGVEDIKQISNYLLQKAR